MPSTRPWWPKLAADARLRSGLLHMAIATAAFVLMAWSIQQVGRLPPAEIVYFRSAVSLALTLVWVIPTRAPLLGRRRGLLFLRGFVGFVALWCYAKSLTLMPLTNAVALQYTNPVFAALFAALLLRERFGWGLVGALLLCLAGAWLVANPSLDVPLAGGLFGLGSAVMSGVAYTIVRALRTTEHPMTVVLSFALVALPLSGLLMLPDFRVPQGREWGWLLLTGVLTQIGQVFLTLGLHAIHAAKATSVSYLAALFSALLEWVTTGRVPAPEVALGAALIVAGIVTLSSRRPRGTGPGAPPEGAPALS
jgi:drug/metabolite transporter (DMT)-like permease